MSKLQILSNDKMEFDSVELAVKGKQLCNSNQIGLGIKCLETALTKGIDDINLVMAVQNELGNAYFSIKDYKKAMTNYSKNVHIAKLNSDLDVESISNGNISSVLKMLGRYDEAVIYCGYHLKSSKEQNNKIETIKALYNMGNIYYDYAKTSGAIGRQDIGQFSPQIENLLDKAVECYKDALKINKKIKDNNLQSKILGNYANVHYLLNNYKKSVKLTSEKLQIDKVLFDKQSERRSYINRGNVYVMMKNYEFAIQDYANALEIARLMKDLLSEIKLLYTIGNTHYIARQYQSALDSMLAYRTLVKNNKYKKNESRANLCVSIIYAEIGDYVLSKLYAEQHGEMSRELGDQSEIDIANENLIRIENMIKYIEHKKLNLVTKSKFDSVMLPDTKRNIMRINLPDFINISELVTVPNRIVDEESPEVKETVEYSDDLFSLLTKYQMKQLTQSHDFDVQIVEEQFNNYISSSKKIFLDTLLNSQSRRLDEQRAELNFITKL